MKQTTLLLSFLFISMVAFSQSWQISGNTYYVNPTTTDIGIGTSSASSKLEVKSSTTKQSPFVVKNQYGQTKLKVHPNGGVSIGNDLNPPVDGLAVENHLVMNFYKWMGFGPTDEGTNRLQLHHNTVHGYVDYKDNLHFRADRNWISSLTLYGNGSVGVGFGTTYNAGDYRNQGYKLAVNGGIICEEVKVIVDVPDAGYVFDEDYDLTPLNVIEQFVKENKHLPDIPSAEQFKKEGYKVGEMDEMLLRKIEELTL
ncbi:MAG: hypothetical protein H0S84_13160 [Bacteroidales bacterium]|jgi:hypothetical protein|nr:hypothetical protein [Bacteroidales bacterium]